MSEVIIYDDEFITVRYLDDERLIYHTIHKAFPDQALIDALNAGTEALAAHGVCKWLSDDRKSSPLSPELVAFGSDYFQPRTIAAGWKYWANVVPEEVAAAGALAPVIDNAYDLGLRMMVFTTLEDAFHWLAQMEE